MCKQLGYEHIPAGYEDDYHQIKHQYLYTNPSYYKARAELSRRRYFGDIEDLDNKKILEFGVGLGHNMFTFKKAIGYDISEFAVRFSYLKGIPSTTDINKIPNNFFDIVFSAHVLEHVDNPLETLRVMYSKLKKGGKLILITPIDKIKKIDGADMNQHLYTWTPQLMNNLLTKAGFEIISCDSIPTFAYKKLLPFRMFGLATYDWVTRVAGVIMRDKELKFVAVKR